MKKLFIFSFMVFILSSCDNHEKLTAYFGPVKELQFPISVRKSITDINFLFFIDASSSMDEERENLSQNIKLLFEPVFKDYSHYNYNFAFTSLSPLSYIRRLKKQAIFVEADKESACEVGSLKFSRKVNIGDYLSYSSQDLGKYMAEDLICVISHNIMEIDGDNSNEPFFDSFNYIITESDLTFKTAFFGKNKILILFFISDAHGKDDKRYKRLLALMDSVDKASDVFAREQLQLLENISDKLSANVRSYAVVVDDRRADECGEAVGSPGSSGSSFDLSYPFHLYKFVERTNGLRFSICEDSWSQKLTRVFEDLRYTLRSDIWYINEFPKMDSIEVSLNNKKIPNDPKKGWFFDPFKLSLEIGPDFDFVSYIDKDHQYLDQKITVRYNPINIELLKEED